MKHFLLSVRMKKLLSRVHGFLADDPTHSSTTVRKKSSSQLVVSNGLGPGMQFLFHHPYYVLRAAVSNFDPNAILVIIPGEEPNRRISAYTRVRAQVPETLAVDLGRQ